VGLGLEGALDNGEYNLALNDGVKGCPTYQQVKQPSMADFDVKKYTGRWYVHEELDTHHKMPRQHKQSAPRAGEGPPVGAARLQACPAWLALYLESFRALLPASWDDLALVSGWVLIF